MSHESLPRAIRRLEDPAPDPSPMPEEAPDMEAIELVAEAERAPLTCAIVELMKSILNLYDDDPRILDTLADFKLITGGGIDIDDLTDPEAIQGLGRPKTKLGVLRWTAPGGNTYEISGKIVEKVNKIAKQPKFRERAKQILENPNSRTGEMVTHPLPCYAISTSEWARALTMDQMEEVVQSGELTVAPPEEAKRPLDGLSVEDVAVIPHQQTLTLAWTVGNVNYEVTGQTALDIHNVAASDRVRNQARQNLETELGIKAG